MSELTIEQLQQRVADLERCHAELLEEHQVAERELAEARERIGELERRLEVPNDPNADWNNAQLWTATLREVEQLRTENDRLRRGEFTQQEFQNLCHNLPTAQHSVEVFCRGCEDYQQELFGRSPITELRAERDALKGEHDQRLYRLTSELAALRSAAEWRPMATAPPTEDVWALVYGDGAKATRAWNHNRQRWEDWEGCQYPGLVLSAITHWMPLPAPPAALGEERKGDDE